MLGDVPRLAFRRRGDGYSALRILVQGALQNLGYMLALGIVYFHRRDAALAVLLIVYVLVHLLRTIFQLREGTPYWKDRTEDVVANDFVVKPLRIFSALAVALILEQPLWAIGTGVLITKWLLNLLLDRAFLAPRWYHASLVLSGVPLVIGIFSMDLGQVAADTVKQFLSTIAQTYVTFVGLLAVVLGMYYSDGTPSGERERTLHARNIVLMFACCAVLAALCVIGILIFGTSGIDLSAGRLVGTTKPANSGLMGYVFFGTLVSLSWLLWLFTVEVAYLIQHRRRTSQVSGAED